MSKPEEVTPDECDRLRHCVFALQANDPATARFLIAPLEGAFAGEIDMLIRVSEYADAIQRIERFLHPKYPNEEACALHAQETIHFDQSTSRRA